MAALCTMGNKQNLIDDICVARNEKIGVYGFVFFRGMYIRFPFNIQHPEAEADDTQWLRWRMATIHRRRQIVSTSRRLRRINRGAAGLGRYHPEGH